MNEFDDDLPQEAPDFDSGKDEDDESPVKRELLTIRLFKEAVKKAKGKLKRNSGTLAMPTSGKIDLLDE
jgi:hypothetical protein